MKKLLLIDDSEDLLDAMSFFLTKRGYEVKVISKVDNVILTINNFRPDLVMLDIKLSGKDGREICKEIRLNHLINHTCILMISSAVSLLENYKDYGADGILEKPFGLSVLEEMINSVLKTCKDRTV